MINWVIQNNLINENDLGQINSSAIESGSTVTNIEVIPFDSKLPLFKISDDNIYFGSTTLMYNIYTQLNKPRGLFFNEDIFQMDNYNNKWGTHMLNYSAIVTTFGEVDKLNLLDEDLLFIRPNKDDKSFDGRIMTFSDIKDWKNKLLIYDNVILTEDTKILIGEPYNIKKEWRLFIVGGEIVSSTLYRKNFLLNKSSIDIPENMIKFAKERISEYTPHDNFIMDIALCGDSYYIIECGCINSCGFYAGDISKIVSSITDWMIKSKIKK